MWKKVCPFLLISDAPNSKEGPGITLSGMKRGECRLVKYTHKSLLGTYSRVEDYGLRIESEYSTEHERERIFSRLMNKDVDEIDKQNNKYNQIWEHRTILEKIPFFAKYVPYSCKTNKQTTNDCRRHDPIAVKNANDFIRSYLGAIRSFMGRPASFVRPKSSI